MDAFSWCCPFCNHNATITENHFASERFEFHHGNKYGYQAIRVVVVTCPNPECSEYTLQVTLHDHLNDRDLNQWRDLPSKQSWQLVPASEAKVFPSYVPEAITADYKEACLIRDLSPKASATLARRCLQGMIRDFWNIKKGNLQNEIIAIQDKVNPTTWEAIDAVRKIGNIAAHMEKDIDVIVEVDPREAKLLIELIETLIQDWYVTKYEREKRLVKIVELATDKENARKQPSKADSQPQSSF